MNHELVKSIFTQDGYVLIPGFLSKDEVSEIAQNFNRVIQEVTPNMPNEKVFYEDKTDLSTLKQLIDIHKYDEFFNQVLTNGKFKDIAEYLLADEVVGKLLNISINLPVLETQHLHIKTGTILCLNLL